MRNADEQMKLRKYTQRTLATQSYGNREHRVMIEYGNREQRMMIEYANITMGLKCAKIRDRCKWLVASSDQLSLSLPINRHMVTGPERKVTSSCLNKTENIASRKADSKTPKWKDDLAWPMIRKLPSLLVLEHSELSSKCCPLAESNLTWIFGVFETLHALGGFSL